MESCQGVYLGRWRGGGGEDGLGSFPVRVTPNFQVIHFALLTLLHSERPKLYTVFCFSECNRVKVKRIINFLNHKRVWKPGKHQEKKGKVRVFDSGGEEAILLTNGSLQISRVW